MASSEQSPSAADTGDDAARTKTIYEVYISRNENTKDDETRCFETRHRAVEVLNTFITSSGRDWQSCGPIRDNQGTTIAENNSPFNESILLREDIENGDFWSSAREFQVGFYTARLKLGEVPTDIGAAPPVAEEQQLPQPRGQTQTIYFIDYPNHDEYFENRRQALITLQWAFETSAVAWSADVPVLDNQGAAVDPDSQFVTSSMFSREDIDDFDISHPWAAIQFHTRQLELRGPEIKSANKR